MSELATVNLSPLARADEGAGVLALAMMSEADFEARLQHLTRGQERLRRLHAALMVPEVDYGAIPGTGDKKTLLKSGAEKLCLFYSLRASFEVRLAYGDGETEPPVSALVECRLHLGDTTGPVVAVGYGTGNTWETKHRRRRGERVCPACGVTGALNKGKDDRGGGWYCWAKRGGCGATFGDRDPAIIGQMVGDVENPDQHDLANTILKMAEKRAFVDATLRATATSGMYMQDLEDIAPAAEQPPQNLPPAADRAGKPFKPPVAEKANGKAANGREVQEARAQAFAAFRAAGGDTSNATVLAASLAEALGRPMLPSDVTKVTAQEWRQFTEFYGTPVGADSPSYKPEEGEDYGNQGNPENPFKDE